MNRLAVFNRFTEAIVPFDKMTDTTNTRITNVVSKVFFVRRGQTINIHAILTQHPTQCKFDPKKFPAVIIKLKDDFSCAGLIFNTGKMMIVGAKTKYQSLLGSHQCRKLIEQVEAPYRDPATGEITIQTLENKLAYTYFQVENMMANVYVGGFPNLAMLFRDLPRISNWNPELFPALKIIIWKTAKRDCTCAKKRNMSCACNITVSLFDTGKMNISGCRNHSDVNYARKHMLTILDNDQYQDKGVLVSKEKRFDERRRKLLRGGVFEFPVTADAADVVLSAAAAKQRTGGTRILTRIKAITRMASSKKRKLAPPGRTPDDGDAAALAAHARGVANAMFATILESSVAGQVMNVARLVRISPDAARCVNHANQTLADIVAGWPRAVANKNQIMDLLTQAR